MTKVPTPAGSLAARRTATALDEEAAFIPTSGEELFGILTRPTIDPNGITLITLSGGSWTTSIGRNRTYVKIARRMASFGFHSFRLDYLGTGESTGATREYRLDAPFTDDPLSIARWLEQRGLRDVVLLGTCFGARLALAAAPDLPGLRGAALFPPPVRDFDKGQRIESLPIGELVRRAGWRKVVAHLRHPGHRRRYLRLARKRLARRGADGPRRKIEWVSDLFVDSLELLVDRKVPVLIVYGEADDFYRDFQRGEAGRLGEVLRRAGSLVTLTVVEGHAHGLRTLEVQEQVLAALADWLMTLAPGQADSAQASPASR